VWPPAPRASRRRSSSPRRERSAPRRRRSGFAGSAKRASVPDHVDHLRLARQRNGDGAGHDLQHPGQRRRRGATSSTGILLQARTATPATALAWDRFTITFEDDGPELVGDGTLQWGVTANAVFVTNAPTWDVLITGYEFT
jgi:hypothetical protein